MSSIWPVGHDQIAAAIGSRYQSENAAEYRPWRRNSRSGSASSGCVRNQAVLSRLKRRMSDSMRQKAGRRRLLF